MENTTRSNQPRSYQDFQPSTEWISDDVAETLLIRLPGFNKEHLKVQMDNLGNLRAIGERPLDAAAGRYSRFQTEHSIPHNCDVRGVKARFDDNILHITFPKLITKEPKPTLPTTPTSKPEPEPTPEPEKKPPMLEQNQTPKPESKPTPEPEKKALAPEQKQEPAQSREEEKENVKENEKEKEVKEKEGDKKAATVAAVATVAAATVAAAPTPEKMGIGFLEGIKRSRQLVVNMFVAVIVIVVFGMYVGYKLRSGGWGEEENS